MSRSRHIQTMADSYRAICQSTLPWVALGDFLNEWFDYSRERRADLVVEPVIMPADPTPELMRWAAFCAASAEWLCAHYHVPCPAWVNDPSFHLPEPWFDSPQAHKLPVRQRLIERTPEPFTRRNIYCGDRVFANKYEFAAQHQQLRARYRNYQGM